MSVTLWVFLDEAKLPSTTEWSAAMRSSGFGLELDEDIDVRTASGFLPCDCEGAASGFELSVHAASEILAEQGIDATRIGTRGAAVELVTHSDMREAMCSAIAAGVLCATSDGVLWDTEANEWVAASDAMRWAREMEAEFRKSL